MRIINDLRLAIYKRGFTLIELLIVIAVIGILAGGVIILINPAEQFQKARDSQRKSDLSQIQKGLELYFQDNGRYPSNTTTNISDNCGTPPAPCPYRIKADATTIINWGDAWLPYMGNLPKDPSSPSKNYAYFSNGQSYYLFASLDNAKDPQVCPGTACAAANGNKCGGTNNCSFGVSSPDVLVSAPAFGYIIPIPCRGGTITTGSYTVHTFIYPGGTLTCDSTFTGASVLVVGGGGGGSSGGGGAGGYLIRIGTETLNGSIPVTVGVGGAGGAASYTGGTFGSVGGDSIFGTLISKGGGGGAPGGSNGLLGGSGGGGGGNGLGGAGTAEQGNGGGTGSSGWQVGGGGGGAGGGGGNGNGSSSGGDGGIGLSNSFSGSDVCYAGGGGGGGRSGVGGATCGGGAGSGSGSGTSGVVNTGGGGGGGNGAFTGAAGGSGVVIIRYLTP